MLRLVRLRLDTFSSSSETLTTGTGLGEMDLSADQRAVPLQTRGPYHCRSEGGTTALHYSKLHSVARGEIGLELGLGRFFTLQLRLE